MTDRAFSRLRRCAVWTESYRSEGYVVLDGYMNGKLRSDAFLESDLLELLKAGKVEVDESPRLTAVTSDNRIKKVYNKYWKVKD